MSHERKMKAQVTSIMNWYNNCDVAYSEIARESGLHVTSLRTDGRWNPSGETLIKLARARDKIEKRLKLEEKLEAAHAQAAKT